MLLLSLLPSSSASWVLVMTLAAWSVLTLRLVLIVGEQVDHHWTLAGCHYYVGPDGRECQEK